MSAPAAKDLTVRERQCITLAARGYTNAQIGRHLYLSEDTVKSHMRRAYYKLGVPSRILAVEQARRRRLFVSDRDLRLQPDEIEACPEHRIAASDLHLVVCRWVGRAPAGFVEELRQLLGGWTPSREIA